MQKNPLFQKKYFRTQEKSGCAIKIVISAFIFLQMIMLGLKPGFLT